MQKYELFAIFPGTRAENEATTMTEMVKTIISEIGATKIETQPLGKMKIAYPINHIRYGYFYNFFFESESEVASKIQNRLRHENDLLRAIVKKSVERIVKPLITTAPGEARVTVQKEQITPEVIKAAEAPTTYNADVPAPKQATAVKSDKKSLEDLDEKIDKILDSEFIKDI